jgi:Isochorismatase family
MDAHPRLAEWWSWLDPLDRLLYEQAGFRSPSAPVRARSALLVIDVVRRFVGSRPAPVREAIREYPTSCGERAWAALPLESFLRARGVAAVAVCGGTTSGCVRASCVDAFSAGFFVVVAEDACFDRARQPHLANLFDLGVKYAAVLSAAEVAERLELSQ